MTGLSQNVQFEMSANCLDKQVCQKIFFFKVKLGTLKSKPHLNFPI